MIDEFYEERCKVYLTSRDVAQRFSRSMECIKRWRWQGKGPPYKRIGRYYYYDLVDVINFEAQQAMEKSHVKTF